MNKLTDNEIVKSLESLLDIMRAYESQQASIGKGLVEDIISMYNRQKAEKEAMLSHIKCLQYENEKLQEENKKQKAILEAINDEINPLPFETDFDRAMNKAKSEAIKEFIKEFKDKKFDEFSKLTKELYGYDLTTDINRLAVFNLFNTCINDILEEMTEQRGDSK